MKRAYTRRTPQERLDQMNIKKLKLETMRDRINNRIGDLAVKMQRIINRMVAQGKPLTHA